MAYSTFSQSQKIEYYLGKNSLPNLHWNSCIPAMWDIPARVDTHGFHSERMKNKEIHDINFPEVKYLFNNLGYRSHFDYTDDLKNKSVILILGCSDAFGQCVNFQQIYSTVLQENLPEYTILNLAVAGASPDSATRIGVQTIQYLGSNIKHVCMLWPVFSLREFVSKTFKSGVHTLNNSNVPYNNWWDHIDWVSNNYNYRRNKLLLSNSARAINAEYHDLIINRNDHKVPYDYISFNEYTALGPLTHQAIANYFYKKITKNPSLFQSTQS